MTGHHKVKPFLDPPVVRRAALEAFKKLDPRHQVTLQSMLDLPGNFSLDLVGRYVSALPVGVLPPVSVPDYITFDARLGWTWRNVEIAVIGRNLADHAHNEFGPLEIPRSVFAQLTLRF